MFSMDDSWVYECKIPWKTVVCVGYVGIDDGHSKELHNRSGPILNLNFTNITLINDYMWRVITWVNVAL